MNDSRLLIGQMIVEIDGEATRLDDGRKRLFLEWLKAHSSQVKSALDSGSGLPAALEQWFLSIPTRGLLWEYRLVLEEITWWRELNSNRLRAILEAERN